MYLKLKPSKQFKTNFIFTFCEGREAGDAGDIDILVKRSFDNGKTWRKSELQKSID